MMTALKTLALFLATASAYEFKDRLDGTKWGISPNVTLGCVQAPTIVKSMASLLPQSFDTNFIVFGINDMGVTLRDDNTWSAVLHQYITVDGTWTIGTDGLPALTAEQSLEKACELFDLCNDTTLNSILTCGFSAKVTGKVLGDTTHNITTGFTMTVELDFPNLPGATTNGCATTLGCAASSQEIASETKALPDGLTSAPTAPSNAPTAAPTDAPTSAPTASPTVPPTPAPTDVEASDARGVAPAMMVLVAWMSFVLN